MYYCCTGRNTTVTDLGVPDGELHDLLPVAVYNLEEASLLGHLLHDVLGGEDGLEVEPLGLHLEPLIDRVLDPDQPVLPFLQPHVSWLLYTSVKQPYVCQVYGKYFLVNHEDFYGYFLSCLKVKFDISFINQYNNKLMCNVRL